MISGFYIIAKSNGKWMKTHPAQPDFDHWAKCRHCGKDIFPSNHTNSGYKHKRR